MERRQRLGMARRHRGHEAGIEPADEQRADRNVADQTQLDRLIELALDLVDDPVLAEAAEALVRFAVDRVDDRVPGLNLDLAAANPCQMSGQQLDNAIDQRVGRQRVDVPVQPPLGEALAIEAVAATVPQQRLDLRREQKAPPSSVQYSGFTPKRSRTRTGCRARDRRSRRRTCREAVEHPVPPGSRPGAAPRCRNAKPANAEHRARRAPRGSCRSRHCR